MSRQATNPLVALRNQFSQLDSKTQEHALALLKDDYSRSGPQSAGVQTAKRGRPKGKKENGVAAQAAADFAGAGTAGD